MKIIINIPDHSVEKIVRSIMDNFPEASRGASLNCRRCNYEKMEFHFVDGEEGKFYELDKPKLIAAFRLIFTDKWPKGCTPPPMTNDSDKWDDWLCQCDATDFDAFIQLAIFKEVIYG